MFLLVADKIKHFLLVHFQTLTVSKELQYLVEAIIACTVACVVKY
jgi:hypothetical protein